MDRCPVRTDPGPDEAFSAFDTDRVTSLAFDPEADLVAVSGEPRPGRHVRGGERP